MDKRSTTRFGTLARNLLCTTLALTPGCIGDGTIDGGEPSGDAQLTPCPPTEPEAGPNGEPAAPAPLEIRPSKDPCPACGRGFVDERGRKFLDGYAR